MTVQLNFKEGLIEAIKVAGQMIIENAEDIAGKTEHMSHLNISVDFDPEMRCIPEMTITRSHLPKISKMEHILDTFTGEKDGVETATISCQYCGKYSENHPNLKYYVTSDGIYVCEDCRHKTNKSVAPVKEKKR